MRTTVDISEKVLERAKHHAAKTGQTLSSLVTEALGAYLVSRPQRSVPPFELIVRGHPGGRFPSSQEIAQIEAEEELASLRIPGAKGSAST